MNSKSTLLFLLNLIFIYPSYAKINVVTTTTDLAWMAREVGGELVTVRSFLDGSEDPHYVDALPGFIHLAANADVLCFVGLDLEVGWLPKILSRSGNSKVQRGGEGYCDTGSSVPALEIPTGRLDRSMGDVHPRGNPHFWLDPKAFLRAGHKIADVFSRVSPEKADQFHKSLSKVELRLNQLLEQGRKKLASLKGKKIIQYHQEFSYLVKAYGLQSIGALEEKPGIPPSAARIAKVALAAKRQKIQLAIAAHTSPRRVLEKFRQVSGVPFVVFTPSVSAKERYDYIKHHESIIEKIVNALRNPTS